MKSLREILPLLDHCTRHSFELTRRHLVKGALGGGVLAAGASGLATLAGSAVAHASGHGEGTCDNLVPAAAGGPTPADRNVISLRWLGCACFELVYRNQVILLDTWYDRPLCRDIGLTPQQVTRANLIVIGHAHFDHIADAASIALRTGATVIADQTIGNGVLLGQGLPARQIRAVNGLGGELLSFNGFTVQPILAHHSVPPHERKCRRRNGGAGSDRRLLCLAGSTVHLDARIGASDCARTRFSASGSGVGAMSTETAPRAPPAAAKAGARARSRSETPIAFSRPM